MKKLKLKKGRNNNFATKKRVKHELEFALNQNKGKKMFIYQRDT